jgi:hypothetical protein
MSDYFDAKVVDACKSLFGRETIVTRDFLKSLGQQGLKSAFRKKAFETHPDLHGFADSFLQQRQTALFLGVRTAYSVLTDYLLTLDIKQRPTQAAFSTTVKNDWYTAGSVPPFRLEIGRYLYYRGCIPYAALIKALGWQQRQRPSIGAIAKEWRWLTDEQILTILSYRGMPRLFGERAVHFKYLTEFRVRTALAFQRKKQQKIGQFFIETGLLTEEKIEQMVQELKLHNSQLSMPMRKTA